MKFPVGVVVMGPCGSGKSQIGSRLADTLGFAFVDADDLHPPSNVQKMASGIPLTDNDRIPWLKEVRNHMDKEIRKKTVTDKLGVVVACSALKKSYRDILRGKSEGEPNSGDDNNKSEEFSKRLSVVFAYLSVCRFVLETRLALRRDHFMKGGMLESQLKILEEPPHGDEEEVGDTIVVGVPNIEMTVEEVVNRIAEELKNMKLVN